MSEEDAKHFCVRNATPKHREIWRNIAIMAWIMGTVPGMVAVVTLTGTSTMFAILVVLNIIFLIVNFGFCCANLQTLKKKRYFYITCLLFMVAITAVIVVTVVTAPENEFQIAGFVGGGLTFFSCIAFLILDILLHIHGPEDPVSSESNATPEECDDDTFSGILTIRYVSTLRGRIQEESFFRVQGGQILSRSPPDQVNNATQSVPSTQRTRRPSVFGFRTREESEPERERRQSIERLPVHIISDGVHSPQRRDSAFSHTSFNPQRRDSAFSHTSFNPQRRDSAFSQTFSNPQRRDSAFSQTSCNSQRRDSSITITSIHRRTSTSSIEYDTTSVRCTCYYLPNESDSDDVPPYADTPTGNMTVCPLHGENPIPTPAYDDNTSTHSSLYRILGLPEYDEVVITKPAILPSMLKDATVSSPSDNLPTSIPTTTKRPMDSLHRTGPLSDRLSNAHNQIIFETIFEDRAERSDSFLSQSTSQESDVASTSATVTTDVASTSAALTTTNVASTSATVTTDVASTSATVTTDVASTSATLTTTNVASTSATVTTDVASTSATVTTDVASTSATVTTTNVASTSATLTTTNVASTSATVTTEVDSTSAAVTTKEAASTGATVTTTDAASSSATVTTTDAASSSATVTTTDVSSTSAAVTTTDAASTSATITTDAASAADGPSVVITTTSADFTNQTTFSTSKQTA